MSIKLPEGIGFTAEDFDFLRKVLHRHLGDVLPVRDYRQLIIDLIDDVKQVARDEANAKLPALFGAWIKREGVKVLKTHYDGFEFWSEDGTGSEPTHEAYLVLPTELTK